VKPVELSVITTSMNLDQYLEECILSVDKQRQWFDAKVNHLIMDGGSTDDTLTVLRRHADKIIPHIVPGEGQTPALNHAMQIIEEEYPDTTHIGWVNADDYYQDYWLHTMLTQLKKEPPDVAMVCSDAKVIGMAKGRTSYGTQRYFGLNYLGTYGNAVCQPTVLIRMPAFKKLKDLTGTYFNVDADYDYCQDLELWYRFLINGYRIRYIDKITAVLRLHKLQLSLVCRAEQIIGRDRILKLICDKEGIPMPRWVGELVTGDKVV